MKPSRILFPSLCLEICQKPFTIFLYCWSWVLFKTDMKHVSRKKSREALHLSFQIIQLFLSWLLHLVIWETVIGKIMLNCTLQPDCSTNTKNLKWKDNQHPKNDMSLLKFTIWIMNLDRNLAGKQIMAPSHHQPFSLFCPISECMCLWVFH